ncbi:type II toxin-antitoxin system PemK/MazF family toxin [Lactobacillus sp. M0396]|uniref:type II toxin-antitoxin system PemK/MazF family toxin n=1 Tax=Lactobacillus sp. M0396 TaxID=2751030 RepID=UPI0018DB337C|nr:type II toxin-antitoxin system PemK/MazF family toxin [Lactobacillus sp. M0396]MBI0033058.1 type II toxin-antitoxin system PemK/MazF family toxin [Lactobacillus sp. M0396]
MNEVKNKIGNLRSWERQKENLSKNCINCKSMVHQRYAIRGSIYLINFGENIGSEINKKRPGLIVSNRTNNLNSDNVVALPITKTLVINKKTHRPKYSSQYFLYKSKYTFLDFDSCVKCEQIRTISKARILKYLGNLDKDDLKNIILKLNKFFS